MLRTTLALIFGLAGMLPMAQSALAQSAEMSQDEIIERFKAQKTRGLMIAPVVTTPAQPDAPTTVTQNNVAIMPADQQVNINISFDFDSAALRADQKPKLTALCGAMQAVDNESFLIIGHTDAAGSAEYNQKLSKLRAEEVKRFIVSDCGIASERLEAMGVGKDALLDPDNPRADVNRRVEFQVLG